MEYLFTFSKDEAKEMAVFVAQLIREGVTFEVVNVYDGVWIVKLTGGF